MLINSARPSIAIGLAALFSANAVFAQQDYADEAADAAEIVAAEAEDAIRAIDPTNGGDSLVVDPSLPTPYGHDDGSTDVEDLPELPPASTQIAPLVETPAVSSAPAFDEVTYGTVLPRVGAAIAAVEEPRGPAARMISQPMVQDVPAPAPAPLQASAANDDPFVINSILPIEGTIRYGEWYWDESQAPADGKLVITVDLDARVISVFRDGHEIGTAVALVGTQRHPTPLGTFPILTKERDNVSEKYNNAPMPWTLRLTWDGVAIHGSRVMNGYASHGCIGVPDPFAERLFEIAKRGDRVVITRGQYIGVGDRLIS